jgi:hypothetical protein
MRYFYDFEFLEDGRTIEPISVGVVAEDGREYYAVFSEIQEDHELHDRICHHRFLMEHVVPFLPMVPRRDHIPNIKQPGTGLSDKGRFALDMNSTLVRPKRLIRAELLEFLLEDYPIPLISREEAGAGPDQQHPGVELWAYFAAYDHVCLAQLWGQMVKMPKGLPWYTMDLKQEMERLGVSREELGDNAEEHFALSDARWNHATWRWLQEHQDRLP